MSERGKDWVEHFSLAILKFMSKLLGSLSSSPLYAGIVFACFNFEGCFPAVWTERLISSAKGEENTLFAHFKTWSFTFQDRNGNYNITKLRIWLVDWWKRAARAAITWEEFPAVLFKTTTWNYHIWRQRKHTIAILCICLNGAPCGPNVAFFTNIVEFKDDGILLIILRGFAVDSVLYRFSVISSWESYVQNFNQLDNSGRRWFIYKMMGYSQNSQDYYSANVEFQIRLPLALPSSLLKPPIRELMQRRWQRQRQRQKTMTWLVEWGKIIVLHVRHVLWWNYLT